MEYNIRRGWAKGPGALGDDGGYPMKKFLVATFSVMFALASLAQTKAPVTNSGGVKKPAQKTVAAKTKPVAILQTDLGKIVIEFYPDKAPKHVKNFLSLCRSGFYNGTKFHRVIPGFMIQGGDPNTKAGDPSTWGMSGNTDKNGQEINVPAEFNDIKHERGIVSMARAQDPNSASSQFFIMVAAYPSLDGKYSAFGRVIEGMDIVDKIVNGQRDMSNDRPFKPVSIVKAWVEQRPIEEAKATEPAKPQAIETKQEVK